ncbi:hypothetical protein BDB01DRAFT_834097 [Pilobolus umbonatus]|nr:hypothetical protein BDB01DRAFT_834097 [Pilobolus umbonatus]
MKLIFILVLSILLLTVFGAKAVKPKAKKKNYNTEKISSEALRMRCIRFCKEAGNTILVTGLCCCKSDTKDTDYDTLLRKPVPKKYDTNGKRICESPMKKEDSNSNSFIIDSEGNLVPI